MQNHLVLGREKGYLVLILKLCTLFIFLSSKFLRTNWRVKYCRLGDVEFVVCRDDSGKVCAFHNVCRHHASLLASGSGQKSCFVCPYHVSLPTTLNMHMLSLISKFLISLPFSCFGNLDIEVQLFVQGWTYGLNGALLKANRISGMRDFNVKVCISLL